MQANAEINPIRERVDAWRIGGSWCSTTKRIIALQRELNYFIANQEQLVAQYRGKTLVLRGETVEGVYGSVLEAYESAQRRFPIGTFMISHANLDRAPTARPSVRSAAKQGRCSI